MIILSIDLGVRNLAFCKLRIENKAPQESKVEKPKNETPAALPQSDLSDGVRSLVERFVVDIIAWRIEDILIGSAHANTSNLSISDLNRLLQTALKRVALHTDVDIVAIENQPVGFHQRSNTRMKVLSHCIETFMINHSAAKVVFVSPKQKFMFSPKQDVLSAAAIRKASARYREHKKMACIACRSVIGACKLQSWSPSFETAKKKDDLADCFLQGLTIVFIPPPKPAPLAWDALEVGTPVLCLRGKRKQKQGKVVLLDSIKKKARVLFTGERVSVALSASSLCRVPCDDTLSDASHASSQTTPSSDTIVDHVKSVTYPT